MAQGLLIWFVTILLAYLAISWFGRQHGTMQVRTLMILFLYHSLLAASYYAYALYNPSDSKGYFRKVMENYRGPGWFDAFGTGTTFIEFVGYPFIKFLGFNYESVMVTFSFFGFLGILFFYLFFLENVRFRHRFLSVNFLLLIFFLPNIHFWSSSFGKGSLILFGLGLFMYGLKKPGVRILALVLGGWITFQIRPHVFYVLLIATTLGLTFSTRGVAVLYRVTILAISIFLLYYVYEDIMKLTGLDDESIFDATISHRASDLSKATSGIDIMSYSIPEKLFAFWFRPLFFDAPGILGFIVSIENLILLLIFLNGIRPSYLSFLWTADAVIKTSLLTFLGVSFALAQISGNLGLAMRQKSQVMILVLFVMLKFMDYRLEQLMRRTIARRRLEHRRPTIVTNPSP